MAKTAKRPAHLDPWERQPGEGAKAFEAFAVYRNLGPERSQQRVSKHLAKSRQLICKWSRKFDWVQRAAAWDREQDRIGRISHEKAIREMNERHARIAKSLQSKVLASLKDLKPGDLKPLEMARFLEAAMKYERLAMGADTAVVKHEIVEEAPPENHMQNLSEEELRALASMGGGDDEI